MPPDPEPSTERRIVVQPGMTAAAVASEDGEAYPAVLGTPFLIAELERTCGALLQPLLGDGEVSVGVDIEIRHLAPTPVGALLTCKASFNKQDGKLFWFDVLATDAGGTVSAGRHSRAIVRLSDIEARAAKRADQITTQQKDMP